MTPQTTKAQNNLPFIITGLLTANLQAGDTVQLRNNSFDQSIGLLPSESGTQSSVVASLRLTQRPV